MQIQMCEGAVLSRAETVLQSTTHDTVRAEIGYGEKVSRRLWSKKLEEGIDLTASYKDTGQGELANRRHHVCVYIGIDHRDCPYISRYSIFYSPHNANAEKDIRLSV